MGSEASELGLDSREGESGEAFEALMGLSTVCIMLKDSFWAGRPLSCSWIAGAAMLFESWFQLFGCHFEDIKKRTLGSIASLAGLRRNFGQAVGMIQEIRS